MSACIHTFRDHKPRFTDLILALERRPVYRNACTCAFIRKCKRSTRAWLVSTRARIGAHVNHGVYAQAGTRSLVHVTHNSAHQDKSPTQPHQQRPPPWQATLAGAAPFEAAHLPFPSSKSRCVPWQGILWKALHHAPRHPLHAHFSRETVSREIDSLGTRKTIRWVARGLAEAKRGESLF